MNIDFSFQAPVFNCVVGGVSVLDIPRLNVKDKDQARQFVLAYGYDLNSFSDREQLWASYQRAISMIQDHLLDDREKIPDEVATQERLGDLGQLLIFASEKGKEHRELRKWACAILRVMHVYVHLKNDLFSAFNDEIQGQILNPIQESIESHNDKIILGRDTRFGDVQLNKFNIKPFKTTSSSVIKLLARPERVALTLLDKLGVRFVTNNIFDSFRVIRFLVEHHIISFAHIIPDQSNNTLYPLNLFLDVMKTLEAEGKVISKQDWPKFEVDLELRLLEKLKNADVQAKYLQKENQFSGDEYKFIKFINRKLITVTVGTGQSARPFRFFYPYEIQIMDHDTFLKNQSGPMAHDEYKSRQRIKARERVFGDQLEGHDT